MAGQTLSNGQIIPAETKMVLPATQNVQGGILNAAADVTAASREKQIETAQKMGVGQKGAARRKKRRTLKRGGAQNLNAAASLLPSAGSIPGIDPSEIHRNLTDNRNAIVADAAGDKLHSAAPYFPAKAGGKRTKRKSKHGRRNPRTHRRGHNKSTRRHRGSRRNV
jgi:hypothetical protein